MRPLFIGGCSRSGTTMLGDLLGAVPDHVTLPETTFKLPLVQQFGWRRADGEHATARAWLAAHPKYREFGAPPALLNGISDGDLRGLLEGLASDWARQVDKPRAHTFIDHTPGNIAMAKLLLEAWPEAKLIHLVRDGRAVAASIMPLDWGANDPVGAADQWIRALAHGLAAEQAFPDRVLRVHYETVCREPEAQLARVCAFVGVPFAPAMVTGGGFVVPSMTRAQHALVGKRPDASRIDSWRTQLTARDIELFEGRAGQLLPLLGYPLDHADGGRMLTDAQELVRATRDGLRRVTVNAWKSRVRKRRGLLGKLIGSRKAD